MHFEGLELGNPPNMPMDKNDSHNCMYQAPNKHPSVVRANRNEGLAQGPYMAASGFEPATFRTKGHLSATTPFKGATWHCSRGVEGYRAPYNNVT